MARKQESKEIQLILPLLSEDQVVERRQNGDEEVAVEGEGRKEKRHLSLEQLRRIRWNLRDKRFDR